MLSGHPVGRRTVEATLAENRALAVSVSEKEKHGETEKRTQHHNGEQRYWLFKMVFTENNQSEGIMARLLTPGTQTFAPIDILYFPLASSLDDEFSTIVYSGLRLIIFRLIDIGKLCCLQCDSCTKKIRTSDLIIPKGRHWKFSNTSYHFVARETYLSRNNLNYIQ